MESLSPQVVFVAKLPILNPNEFNLWKIRIEQYFFLTDYSLWEVILNDDSPAPTRLIEGVVQPIAPTTAKQKLARNNELKARGNLLMALPDKHQLKFNIHKDAKTLMEAIEKSVVASVSAASAKILISALPNVNTLSNAVIYSFFASQSNSPQLDNDYLKQIDVNDLEEMDLKWQMAMLTRLLLQMHRFHNVMVWAAMTEVFKQKRNLPTMPSWPSPLQVLLVLTMRDNALVVLKQKLKKAEQERDDFKLKLEKFQTSLKNLSQLLASQTNDKTGLGYNTQLGDGYHVVPPPYTGTFMPPKPDLVFHDALNVNETTHTAFNVKLSPTKPDKDLSHTYRPSAPIIED
nr:hypothetical protein [Tanacetum cinerariifolium]